MESSPWALAEYEAAVGRPDRRRYSGAVAYPLPRSMKQRVSRFPGAQILDNRRVRQAFVNVAHVPVAAVARTPINHAPVRFVIFGQGRSGSTLLVDLLDSHPQLYCDEELLHYRLRWPDRYVDGKSRLTRATAYGFKVKPSQLVEAQGLDPAAFLDALSETGWKIIHLKRTDVFRQALSGLVAIERGGQYHRRAGEVGSMDKVSIDPDRLVLAIRGRLRFREIEEEAVRGKAIFDVDYESDLLDADRHGAVAAEIFSWLGLPPSRVEARLGKVSGARWQEQVLNAEAIEQAMHRSGLSHLLPKPI